MHERYYCYRMPHNGWHRVRNRRTILQASLAFVLLIGLIVPVSVAGAHVSLGPEERPSYFLASGTGSTSHAGDTGLLQRRELPSTVTAGDEFEVAVTFTAPADGFHAIGLTDIVPPGWNLSVNFAWTEPQAIMAHIPEPGEAVYIWAGPFPAEVEFTAVYRVSVPIDVAPGAYIFSGSLEYYIQPFPAPSYWATPTGDIQVEVVEAMEAKTIALTGIIREVDGSILPGAAVILYQNGQVITNDVSDQTGKYALVVPGLGEYEVVASKAGFRGEAQTVSVTEPATRLLDFAGDHGLIPNAPSRPYVLACADLWQLNDPRLQLSTSRMLDVISASKYPSA